MSDIVERLRTVLHNDRSVELMNREAADDIERLRAELAGMREQRDEARELYCVEAAHHSVCLRSVIDARAIARNRGWDCLAQKEGGGA